MNLSERLKGGRAAQRERKQRIHLVVSRKDDRVLCMQVDVELPSPTCLRESVSFSTTSVARS